MIALVAPFYLYAAVFAFGLTCGLIAVEVKRWALVRIRRVWIRWTLDRDVRKHTRPGDTHLRSVRGKVIW